LAFDVSEADCIIHAVMPFELQVISAAEFVRIGPQGRLDFKTSKETLAKLAQSCRTRGLDRALLDLRSLPVPDKPLFTPAELAELVETFHEVGFGPRQRLAVLYRHDPHHGARTFAFISRMRGWRVRAFEDFESALLWLSAAGTEKRSPPEGTAIPIQFAGPGKEMARAARKRTNKSGSSTDHQCL
jgi:hypothetical protein